MQNYQSHNVKELILKVSEGDETAFRGIFNIYYNQLAGFIFRISGSEQLAQEIVQDVFLKIWINKKELVNIECFKAYLFVVAKNHAFNCLKQIAREKTKQQEWVNTVLVNASADNNNNNDDAAASAQSEKVIEQAVAMLPPQQKRVYLLSRIDGKKQQEIAAELNVSLETVKKHMVLALRFLKNHVRTNMGILAIFSALIIK